MAQSGGGPFDGVTDAIHLDEAPLVRVLCQVQWPEQTLLNTAFNQIADEIAISLAGTYPISSTQQGMGIEFDPSTGQVRQQALPAARQWSSIDDVWWVYFTPGFVTLENRGKYTNRDEMTSRMVSILESVKKSAQLPAAQRVGWRYVNRLSDPGDIAAIEDLVQVTVQGARAIPAPDDVHLIHSMTDSQFRSSSAGLNAKWGFLPPNAVHDGNITPTPFESWILDLDAFRERRVDFDVASLHEDIKDLASLAYTFFRWAVKDEFINRFGGKK